MRSVDSENFIRASVQTALMRAVASACPPERMRSSSGIAGAPRTASSVMARSRSQSSGAERKCETCSAVSWFQSG